jgi:hypothetical protein
MVGAVAGYLYLTREGRELRHMVEPQFDELASEIRRLRDAAGKLRAAVTEGYRPPDAQDGRGEPAPDWPTSYRRHSGA